MTEKLQVINENQPLQVVNETSAILDVLTRAAADPNTDVEKITKMFELYEMACDKHAKKIYSSALARMQNNLPTVIEKTEAHNSKYATLEDITDQVRPVLKEYGFAVTFRVAQDATNITVTAVLSHEEGHSEDTSIVLPSDTSGSKNVVQAVGSSISYGRRYTLCALLNITTRGEDDDANTQPLPATEMIDDKQSEIITATVMECSQSTKDWFSSKYGGAVNVPAVDFDKLKTRLDEAKAKNKE